MGKPEEKIPLGRPRRRWEDNILLTEYCAGDKKIERNEEGGTCSTYGGDERLYRVLVGKPEGKRTLGRPRRRWEDNKLFTKYCSGDKIERNEMGGASRAYGGDERLYRVLVGKPEGKRPLGRPRRRWEDNIKRDLQEVGRGGYGLGRAGSG